MSCSILLNWRKSADGELEMKAEWTSVSELFHEKLVQYKIPLFQRHYVWDFYVWEPLWKDITEKVKYNKGRSTSSRKRHFTGAIVTQLLDTIEGEVPKYEVIDGQQRLTTFQIILCAIREICEKRYPLIATNADNHMVNKDFLLTNYHDERYKLIREESRSDESDFLLLVDRKVSQCKGGNILEAYNYFREKIKKYADDQQEMSALFTSISTDFGVVQIEIDSRNDESEKIFASLNATGKLLSEFDHLRNNLFLRARTSEEEEDSESLRKDLYGNYWSHFEEDEYWKNRSRDFLRVFLVAKLGPDEVDSALFDIYQRKYLRKLQDNLGFTEGDPELVIHEFNELKKYAEVYQEEIDNDNLETGHRMEFYQAFNINGLQPFLLFLINESKLSKDQIDKVFEILESYVLRRMLCYGPKSAREHSRINSFFKKLFSEDGKDFEFDVGEFAEYLFESKYDEWPTDKKVKEALGNLGSNGKLARYILYRIELRKRKNDQFAEEIILQPDTFTLEHIMPQGWKETWPLPVDSGEPQFFADLYTPAYRNANQATWSNQPELEGLAKKSYKTAHDLARRRKNVVENIGNLTIVSEELNRDGLSNYRFSDKKELLFQHSDLRLNKDICVKYDDWDVEQICRRASTLFKEDFCKIWPYADTLIQTITGKPPAPKTKPNWVSMLAKGDYDFVTYSKGLVSLSEVTVTPEFNVMGSNEEKEDFLERLDIILAYPTVARDDLKSLINNLEERERNPAMNRIRQLRVWDTLLRSSQENQVDVTIKTCSMHHLAGDYSEI